MSFASATPTSSYGPHSLDFNRFNAARIVASSRIHLRRRSFSFSAAAMTTTTAAAEVDADRLQKGIAEFYDESSGLWENIWGEHMHHGFYDPDSSVSLSDHRAAQIRMIEEALRFGGVAAEGGRRPAAAVDVGCGIGGSSRYLARKYGAKCRGITLSPVQAIRAEAIAAAEGLRDKVSIWSLNHCSVVLCSVLHQRTFFLWKFRFVSAIFVL